MSSEKAAAHDEAAVQGGGIDDAIQLANAVANFHYSPWTKSMFRLYGCLSLAYLCGCLNGVCQSLHEMRNISIC